MKNAGESQSSRPPNSTRRSRAAALVRKLLKWRSRTPQPAPADAPAASEPLAPEGKRSGRGAASLAPYLDHGRNSRPGPLE